MIKKMLLFIILYIYIYMAYLRKAKEQQEDLDFIELSSYNNAIAEKMMKDAFPRPKSVVPMKGGPSAEAILEYEASMSKPYIDPHNGTVYNLKIGFNSPDLVGVQTVEQYQESFGVLSPEATAEINQANANRAYYIAENDAYIDMINRFLQGKTSIRPRTDEEQAIFDELEFPTYKAEELVSNIQKDAIAHKQPFNMRDTIDMITQYWSNIKKKYEDSNQTMRNTTAAEIQRLQDNAINTEKANEVRGQQIKANDEKIKEFEKTLNITSKGLFTPERRIGETNEAYLARMETELTDASTAPPYIIREQASMMTSRKFREKLKEIIKSVAEIEQIMSSITDDEEREEIIKNWSDVKPRLLKLNMVNNNKFKPTEYKEFFDAYMVRDRYGLSNVENALKQVGSSLASDISGLRANLGAPLTVEPIRVATTADATDGVTYTYNTIDDPTDVTGYGKIFAVTVLKMIVK